MKRFHVNVAVEDINRSVEFYRTLFGAEPGNYIVDVGLFDDGTGLVICDALAESFPPQCPGRKIPITNPDAVEADFTEEAGVRWTDRVIQLRGRNPEV